MKRPGVPMTSQEALFFAFDWPELSFLKARCNTCGAGVRKAAAVAHMNSEHPGWLETWNNALRAQGL